MLQQDNGYKPFVLEKRGMRKIANQAMQGDVIRGLIECITNSDDSYSRMEGKGLQIDGSIEIQIRRRPRMVIVKDHAEGMSPEEMESKLSREGNMSSGMQEGANVRGNLGFGVKDLVGLGSFKFESLKDGQYSWFDVVNQNGPQWKIQSRPANDADIDLIGSGSGSRLTLKLNKTTNLPKFANLFERISNHYELRLINSSENRNISIIDLDTGQSENIEYEFPDRENIYNGIINFVDYEYGTQIQTELVIFKNEHHEIKKPSDPTRSSGILIMGNKAIYENTLFSYESNPFAHKFSGYIKSPIIEILAKEYDHEEENGIEHALNNPTDLINRDRRGLATEHPFREELVRVIEPVLNKLIMEEEKASKEVNLNKATRTAFKKAGNELSKAITRELDNLENQKFDRGIEKGLPDIAVIPKRLYFLPGETKSLTVRIRDGLVGLDTSLEVFGLENSNDFKVLNISNFKSSSNNEGFSTAQIRIVANRNLSSDIALKIRMGHLVEVATIRIIDEQPIMLIENVQFSNRTVTLKPNKVKRLYILAPYTIFDDVPEEPNIITNKPNYFKVKTESVWKSDDDLGAWKKMVLVEGNKLSESCKISAKLGAYSATCNARVSEALKGIQIEIEISPEDGGIYRAMCGEEDGYIKIDIFGGNKSTKSILGPGFENQSAIESKILFSEIISGEIAEWMMQRPEMRHEIMDMGSYIVTRNEYMKKFLPIALWAFAGIKTEAA